MRRLITLLFLIVVSAAALAQKPADVLAAQIKKETGFRFTYTAPHQKTSGKWAVVVLAIKPAEGSEKPVALGIVEKKAGKWKVRDYFVGTKTKGVLAALRKGHQVVPKSLWPKKF